MSGHALEKAVGEKAAKDKLWRAAQPLRLAGAMGAQARRDLRRGA